MEKPHSILRHLRIWGVLFAISGILCACSSMPALLRPDDGFSDIKQDTGSYRRVPLPPTVDDFQPRN